MRAFVHLLLVSALLALPALAVLTGADAVALAQGQRALLPWAPGTTPLQAGFKKRATVNEGSAAMAVPSPFEYGDVFAGRGGGTIEQISGAGVVKDVIAVPGASGAYVTGMLFSRSGDLYATSFNANTIFKVTGPNLPHVVSSFAPTDPGGDCESMTQDSAGFLYIGQADGSRRILKLNPTTGAKVDSFVVPVGPRGTDWIDLAADQRTMYYTSEGTRIFRYNLATRTAMTDFNVAPLPGPNAYALRILPDGGVIVAVWTSIVRLNSAGVVVRTYDAPGEDSWFAANLDPDGTSFWSGALGGSNKVYKFDIATGAILLGPVGSGSSTVAGLAVYGERTTARCVGNVAPAFVSPTPACGSTINATVGAPVSFTARASDGNANDLVTFSATGTPTGATWTPVLPANGNPVQSAFAWTPTAGQLGNHVLVMRAADACTTVVCTLTINVTTGGGDRTPPECVLTSIIPGPPKQILVTLRDQQSGLASVEVLTATNCTVVIPPFTVGTTNPVVVTATKINQELSSVVTLRVRDVAQNQVICDPVYTTLSSGTPEGFSLSGNYPNPFNPTTKFEFSIPKEVSGSMATLKVYDLLGREIRTLISEPLSAGTYQAEWNATDNTGRTVESGVYLYRLVVGSYSATKKMTLLK